MIEIIHKIFEALKSPGIPVVLMLALHATRTVMIEDDSVPGDNFPKING